MHGAAGDLDLGNYAHLLQPERLVANINALCRDFGADVAVDPTSVMTLMAEFRCGRMHHIRR